MPMLIAWDGEGNIIATLSHLVARDADGNAVGLVDFGAWEAAGRKFRVNGGEGIWEVPGAVASGSWPEHLGGQAHDFRVETENGRPARLVHRASGHVRDRSKVEKEIDKRTKAANGEPVDLRDLVGGPGKALRLNGDGRTMPRIPVRGHVR